VEDLTILSNNLFINKAKDCRVFGNSVVLLGQKKRHPATPDPLFIAKWASEFGAQKKTFKYDFSEPNYLKDFIIKEINK
jgi:hypothetical protein